MSKELREGVVSTAQEALPVVRGFLMGDKTDMARVTAALRMVGFGITVDKSNQKVDQDRISNAIRISNLFPKNEQFKAEYIKLTMPNIPAKLLDAPKHK